jgi:hypothetical protein
MLALTHAVIGSAAGELVENPSLAFLSGVVLHFIFDKVPHYFPKRFRYKEEIAVLDWLLSAVFVWFLFYFHFSAVAIRGAIGGFSVDVVLIPIPMIRNSFIGRWHINRQTHIHKLYQISLDILFIAIALAILLWRR